VNGIRLLGLSHIEVLAILKDLSQSVRIVCARQRNVSYAGAPSLSFTDTHPPSTSVHVRTPPDTQDALFQVPSPPQAFASSNSLSLVERLFKAKSDQALFSGGGCADAPSSERFKSRSLERLTGLATWSSDVTLIELTKGERGLGFSVTNYKVITIR